MLRGKLRRCYRSSRVYMHKSVVISVCKRIYTVGQHLCPHLLHWGGEKVCGVVLLQTERDAGLQ